MKIILHVNKMMWNSYQFLWFEHHLTALKLTGPNIIVHNYLDQFAASALSCVSMVNCALGCQ